MSSKFLTNRWVHIVLLLVLLGGLISLRISDGDWIKSMRNLAFDTYNIMHPREPTDDVVIVDIDEESLQKFRQWPWPRNVMANIVDELDRLGAKAIVFDVVFAERDRSSPRWVREHIPDNEKYMAAHDFFEMLPDYDELFAKAIANAGNVVTGFIWTNDENASSRLPIISRPIQVAKNVGNIKDTLPSTRGMISNIHIISDAAAGNGMFGASTDGTGVIRNVPLLFSYSAGGEDFIYPSLALEALRVMQGEKTKIQVRQLKPDEQKALSQSYLMRIGKYEIPFDETGLFRGYFSKQRPTAYIPIWKVKDKLVQADQIKDKVILIGTSAQGLKDIRSTPLDGFIPGVEVHLNVIEQVLTSELLSRPRVMLEAELIFTISVGLLIILLAPFINAIILFGITILTTAGITFGSYYGFLNQGLLIDPVYPSLSIIIIFTASLILSYIRSESKRREVSGAFGLYVSPDFMEELTKNPDKLKLGGEVKDLSVMFTDIRSFTTISESLTPEELIQLMNDFLTPMSDLVMENRGTIDKYMGDAMMAFWNAPLDDPDHARNACRVALAMNDALVPINAEVKRKAEEEGREPTLLAAGIGINTGPCSVGNMGSKARFAYSALGDAVNLASRLEGQTKTYGVNILIGEDTYDSAPEFAAAELDLLQVKGKTQPVKIFALLGDGDMAGDMAYQKWLRTHQGMLAAYRAGDMDCAAQDLKDARIAAKEAVPGGMDVYYDMYAQRIGEMIKNPPPEDWDGVFIATSK